MSDTLDRSDARSVALTYFEAWRTRDFDRLRTVLADDVTFRGPMGQADDADACIAGLRGMAEHVMTDIVELMLTDGENVLTWFELHSDVADPTPTVNWSQVRDGLITRIRVTFDPRPLLPPEGAAWRACGAPRVSAPRRTERPT